MASNDSHEEEVLVSNKTDGEPKAAVTEVALLLILEKFFEVILNLPTVNRYTLSSINCTLCVYKLDQMILKTIGYPHVCFFF